MKKKFLSLLSVFLLTTMLTSTVSAGGSVRLTKVEFKLGNSLDVSGVLTGLGGYADGVEVELTATGRPVVTCVSPGGKDYPPGQPPSEVSATATQIITQIFKNGTAKVFVEAEPTLTGSEAGCPNKNWTARIDFVFWTHATIIVSDPSTNSVLVHQEYSCETFRDPPNVICTLVQ